MENFDDEEKSDALVVSFANLPSEFIAQTNHQSPYKIEGVSKARLVKDGQQQCLLVYRLYGNLGGIGITQETYNYVRNLFRDLGSRVQAQAPADYDLKMTDEELRLRTGLEHIQRDVHNLYLYLRDFIGGGAASECANIEMKIADLLTGKDIL